MEQLPLNLSKLTEYGGLVTLAVTIIGCETALIWYLIKRLASLGDRQLTVLQENTSILSRLAAIIETRNANH